MDKIGTPIPKQYLVKSPQPVFWDWRYEILKEVGYGTYGNVFKAYDCINKEYVAIKAVDIYDKTADDCQLCAKNIFTEIEKLETIKNSPIVYGKSRMVNFKRYFIKDGHPCIVMEYLGENLKTYTRRCFPYGMPVQKMADIGRQLLEGLAFLSRACVDFGITHADLKPENILLVRGKTLRIKMVDFGLSFFSGLEVLDVVQSLPYRAPEVILGLPAQGSIDMWSVGCILMELLIGERLFKANSEEAVLRKIVQVLGVPPAGVLNRSHNWNQYFSFDRIRNAINFRDPKVKPGAYPIVDLLRYVFKQEPDGDLIGLLSRMLEYDPVKRIKPIEALRHPFFNRLVTVTSDSV